MSKSIMKLAFQWWCWYCYLTVKEYRKAWVRRWRPVCCIRLTPNPRFWHLRLRCRYEVCLWTVNPVAMMMIHLLRLALILAGWLPSTLYLPAGSSYLATTQSKKSSSSFSSCYVWRHEFGESNMLLDIPWTSTGYKQDPAPVSYVRSRKRRIMKRGEMPDPGNPVSAWENRWCL